MPKKETDDRALQNDFYLLGGCLEAVFAAWPRLFHRSSGEIRLCDGAKGETLEAAFERARRAVPPASLLMCTNPGLGLFACLCRELQTMAGDQPIMLHQVSLANLFGHSHWRTIGNWIKALKTWNLLKLAELAIPKARAARYFFTE